MGLFDALVAEGPCSSKVLSRETGLHERYVREWAKGMVAAQYVEYQPETDSFYMTPEQGSVFTDETSPMFVGGVFQFTIPSLLRTPDILKAFREGGGVSFSELGEEISDAIDLMHRPWFDLLLTEEWLPGVPGLVARLEQGISVLDVGCGLGRSTVSVAAAYSRSHVLGIDPHGPSIDKAIQLASERSTPNTDFEPTTLEDLSSDRKFDLILAIDCIHDMHDPVRSLRLLKDLMREDGLIFWSEPTGSTNPLENRNPAGKMRANLSPFHCLTVSLADGGAGLGTIIGEEGARKLATEAGFNSFTKFKIDHPMQQFFG